MSRSNNKSSNQNIKHSCGRRMMHCTKCSSYVCPECDLLRCLRDEKHCCISLIRPNARQMARAKTEFSKFLSFQCEADNLSSYIDDVEENIVELRQYIDCYDERSIHDTFTIIDDTIEGIKNSLYRIEQGSHLYDYDYGSGKKKKNKYRTHSDHRYSNNLEEAYAKYSNKKVHVIRIQEIEDNLLT